MSEQKKEFTGVWIPKVIVEDERLNWTDRACYAEISCYERCFASNAFLAKRLGISESMVSKVISRLKQLEYIYDGGFNGRFRVLIARQGSNLLLGRVAKNGEADQQNIATIDNSIENSEELAVSDETEDSFSSIKIKLTGKPSGNTIFIPTNEEGDDVAPRKKPQTWDKERNIFNKFSADCQRSGLPEPEPVKLWQLTQIRNVLKTNSENDIIGIFAEWFQTASDDNILNIHAALSVHNINKNKMKQ